MFGNFWIFSQEKGSFVVKPCDLNDSFVRVMVIVNDEVQSIDSAALYRT